MLFFLPSELVCHLATYWFLFHSCSLSKLRIFLCLQCCKFCIDTPWLGSVCILGGSFQTKNHDFQLWETYMIHLFDDFLPAIFSSLFLELLLFRCWLNFLSWCLNLINFSLSFALHYGRFPNLYLSTHLLRFSFMQSYF